MAQIPTKRLAVYIVVGLVVLAVGGVGMVSLGSRGTPAEVVTVSGGSGSGAGGSAETGQAIGAATAAGAGTTEISVASSVSSSSTSTTAPPVYAQVAGAVRHPGVYQVAADSRVFQVLECAGGLTADADQEALPLAARVFDGCRIEVPRKGEPHGSVLVTGGDSATRSTIGGLGSGSAVSGGTGSGASSGSQTSKGLVSLNSATVEQLDTLPGIGPKTAQAIVSYRQQHGPFSSVDQLTEVKGIGSTKLEQLRPLVTL